MTPEQSKWLREYANRPQPPGRYVRRGGLYVWTVDRKPWYAIAMSITEISLIVIALVCLVHLIRKW